jgi:hypothetical protein
MTASFPQRPYALYGVFFADGRWVRATGPAAVPVRAAPIGLAGHFVAAVEIEIGESRIVSEWNRYGIG